MQKRILLPFSAAVLNLAKFNFSCLGASLVFLLSTQSLQMNTRTQIQKAHIILTQTPIQTHICICAFQSPQTFSSLLFIFVSLSLSLSHAHMHAMTQSYAFHAWLGIRIWHCCRSHSK